MNVLDLFSGIGGFSYGLESAGDFRTVAFCEHEPYAARVLAKHWPSVPIFPDVREVSASGLAAAGIGRIDVVCGGFPCQDISLAGRGRGLDGARSGLWFEMLRIIDETRPRYVIAENVAALRSRGLEKCLGGLASIGYDAEWHCIPAAAIGAPHRRDRVWIIAYDARGGRCDQQTANTGAGYTLRGPQGAPGGLCCTVADANGVTRDERRPGDAEQGAGRRNADRGVIGADVRHADSGGLAIGQGFGSDARPKLTAVVGTDWWITEPDVGGTFDGFSRELDGGFLNVDGSGGAKAGATGDTAHNVRVMRADGQTTAAPRGPTKAAGRSCALPSLPHRSRHDAGEVGCGAEGSTIMRYLQERLRSVAQHQAHEGVWPRVLIEDRPDQRHEAMAWERGTARVANGVSKRVDRLRCLGNAIVPQIAEMIGRALLRDSAVA